MRMPSGTVPNETLNPTASIPMALNALFVIEQRPVSLQEKKEQNESFKKGSFYLCGPGLPFWIRWKGLVSKRLARNYRGHDRRLKRRSLTGCQSEPGCS